jgi:hypothetical protein
VSASDLLHLAAAGRQQTQAQALHTNPGKIMSAAIHAARALNCYIGQLQVPQVKV